MTWNEFSKLIKTLHWRNTINSRVNLIIHSVSREITADNCSRRFYLNSEHVTELHPILDH